MKIPVGELTLETRNGYRWSLMELGDDEMVIRVQKGFGYPEKKWLKMEVESGLEDTEVLLRVKP